MCSKQRLYYLPVNAKSLFKIGFGNTIFIWEPLVLLWVQIMSLERKTHQGSIRFSGPIVNLTSDVSLMHMHVQNSVTHFSYSKLAFLTRNSLFLLETRFSYSKLTFLTRNLLFLLKTHFSNSKLTFLTRNSLFLLETHFSYSKLAFLTRNSHF